MKIIRKLLILSILSLLILVNITSVFGLNLASNCAKNPNEVTIDIATKIAENKLHQINDFYLDETVEIFSDDGELLSYLFNLKPTGYVVVSGDYRLSPVLAYSFTSSSGNLDSDNIMIDFLKAEINSQLSDCISLDFRNPDWDERIKNQYFEQWPPEGSTSTEGWIETQWSQSSPYNDLCPLDDGDRSVAGCPSIVIAQILNYHKTTLGTRFDDTDDYEHEYVNYFTIDDDYEEYGFPSFPELNSYLGTLEDHYNSNTQITNQDKAALTFACGVAAKQVYTAQVSGTFEVQQAYDAYLKFGCDTVKLYNEESSDMRERLIDNMKNAYPAHLAVVTPDWSAGHNLVIDGYNTDNYFHLNFGWGGYYDGWFLIPDSSMPYELSALEGVIVDIMDDNTGANLDCEGSLIWSEISPGDKVTGSFYVKNIGDSDSELNWEIESNPTWGTWTFSQLSGNTLKPEDDPVKIDITVVAPDRKGRDYVGGVKVINKEKPGDIDYVQISLSTPVIKETMKSRLYDILQYIINLFNLRNIF